MFFNQSVWIEKFCRASPKEHFYQIILESDEQIKRRRILKFGHFAPFLMLQQPKFSMEFKALNNFESLGTFLWSFVEIGSMVKEKMMFKAKS